MALLRALDENVEIGSVAISSLVDAMGPFRNNVLKLLASQGIVDLSPGKWHSQQAFLDAIKDLPNKVGEQTVAKVGVSFARNLHFPSDIDSIENALIQMNDSYRAYYRNGDIGNYKFRKTGERECTMFCSSPYPCAFDQGALLEICNRFKPVDSISVKLEHGNATGCRQTGGLACTYIITW